MINGVHGLLYCRDALKARAFFRDVLGWPHVDAGEGWLIFAMPPAEIGFHPIEDASDAGTFTLSLMCDDLAKTLAALKAKGVKVKSAPADHGYGIVSSIEIPGGGTMGIYEPRHELAWPLGGAKSVARKAVARKARRTKPRRPAKRARGKGPAKRKK
jgi:predicted enzyme related to lactoylglutathione lyase